jgi:hypothetical protein
MIANSDLRPGDVVQLDPDKQIKEGGFFAGCFMLVMDVHPWGAQGFVSMPEKRGEQPGRAFFRATWEDMERVGHATWVPARTAASEEGSES